MFVPKWCVTVVLACLVHVSSGLPVSYGYWWQVTLLIGSSLQAMAEPAKRIIEVCVRSVLSRAIFHKDKSPQLQHLAELWQAGSKRGLKVCLVVSTSFSHCLTYVGLAGYRCNVYIETHVYGLYNAGC